MRKTGWAGALAVLAALSACGKKEGPGTELIFAAGGAPAEVAEWGLLIKDYETARPGTRVALRALPANSDLQLQAMSSALGSGKAPFDLMRLDLVWLADFGARGWLEPLDPYFSPADLAPFGRLADELDRIGGKLLALPWNVDMGLLYSRSDLLAELGQAGPPKSMDELRRLAQAAQKKAGPAGAGLEGFVWQGKAYEGLSCNLMEAYARSGGSAAAVEAKGAFEAGPMLAALKGLRALISDGISPVNTATEMDEEGARLLFQSGRAVFMRNWPYAAALLEGAGSAVRGKVWVSPLPGGKGTLGGWHLALRAGTPKAAAAADFARYLSSRETQLRLARNLGWNPSRLGVYEDLKGPAAPPHLGALRKALPGAVRRPRVNGYAAFSEKAYQAANKVLLGLQSPEAAAGELAAP